jgi:hypothetical protein
VKIWLLIIYGVIAALLIIIGLYYFNIFHVKDALSPLFNGLKLPNLSGIPAWIAQNSVLCGIIATVGTTAITYVIKNYQTNKLLESTKTEYTELAQKTNSLTIAKEQAEATLAQKQKELDAVKTDTTSDILQNRLSTALTEKQKALDQVNTIKDMHDSTMASLFKAGNNTTVYDAIKGETYKVIKLPPETIVK